MKEKTREVRAEAKAFVAELILSNLRTEGVFHTPELEKELERIASKLLEQSENLEESLLSTTD